MVDFVRGLKNAARQTPEGPLEAAARWQNCCPSYTATHVSESLLYAVKEESRMRVLGTPVDLTPSRIPDLALEAEYLSRFRCRHPCLT
jgi:hypothetical protein